MRSTSPLAALLVVLSGCSLDFQAQKDLPPGLQRRIAQKRAEAAERPNDVEVALQLGELYIDGERWFEAAEALNLARQNGGGTDPRVLGALATAYLSLGYFDQVEPLLRDCFQRNRQEPGCMYAAGELMMLVGSQSALEAARTVWSNLVAVAPDHRKAAYVRSALDQINAQLGPPGAPKDAPASRPASQPAARAETAPPAGGAAPPPGHPPTESAAPRPPPGHPPTGDTPAPTGVDPTVPGHAGAAGGEAVGKLNPFGVAIGKAMTAIRKNDAPGAEAAYREALGIRPDDAAALAGLSEALFAQRRLPEAVTTIESAWKQDPKDAQVRWVYGLVMLEAGKRPEAISAWEALARDNPDYAAQLKLADRLSAAKKKVTGAPN